MTEITGGYLSQLIDEIAYEKGWSLREVARRCDLPPATVQKIASKGTTTIPRRETLEALAYGLGVPLSQLLDAAAQDSGLASAGVPQDRDIAITVKAMEELPVERRKEIAALAQAMLASQRR